MSSSLSLEFLIHRLICMDSTVVHVLNATEHMCDLILIRPSHKTHSILHRQILENFEMEKCLAFA